MAHTKKVFLNPDKGSSQWWDPTQSEHKVIRRGEVLELDNTQALQGALRFEALVLANPETLTKYNLQDPEKEKADLEAARLAEVELQKQADAEILAKAKQETDAKAAAELKAKADAEAAKTSANKATGK